MLTTIHNASELTEIILDYRKKGLKIGFVPTMGALHKGHLHLVKMSKNENDITIVSIFVNPTQFNDPRDLEKYPRTLSKDQELLQSTASADILYAPDVDDIYPDGIQSGSDIGLGGLDVMMEGSHSPGHFHGVAQVVNRLLEIVKPDNLY
ncbi:MAG TPA: pantoate--beta-alanine ligase, partial [Saprospiraceae bacterium]|nr:pantoate--beta-alanine ligase [Saprospiraceae bacterium]